MSKDKDAYYFSHDAGARNDERILIIRSLYGWEGYGWYFGICELFREQSDYTLSKNVALLQISLSIAKETFEPFFNKCFELGLFVPCHNDPTRFFSESFMKRMELIDKKHFNRAAAGRLGGLARAAKLKKKRVSVSSGAKALLKQQKEIKQKERKGNNIPPLKEFLDYCRQLPGIDYPGLEFALTAKYDTFVSSGWKDGYNKPIKNWKNTIRNIIPHLKSMNKNGGQKEYTPKQPPLIG